MDQWHIGPSEFDKMPYYRIEYMEEDLKQLLEEKNKQSKSDNKVDNSSYTKGLHRMQSSMKHNSISGKMPNFKMPKL